jgi:retinol dehydrogenase 12
MVFPPGILQFLRGQLFETPALPMASLTGQTIIVTGANTGLGLECAKHLVRLNISTLILACRSIDKGEAAKKILLSSKPGAEIAKTRIEVWELDMSSYVSVVEFADRCENSLLRLDAVVENAGISQPSCMLAEDNESTITVNVISTFLLALLLLPRLRESAAQYCKTARLTIVGSVVHCWADTKDIDLLSGRRILDRLNDKPTANMKNRYFLSKLLVTLCVQELAKQLLSSYAAGEAIKKPLVLVKNVAPG